jgi:hypothetical protein
VYIEIDGNKYSVINWELNPLQPNGKNIYAQYSMYDGIKTIKSIKYPNWTGWIILGGYLAGIPTNTIQIDWTSADDERIQGTLKIIQISAMIDVPGATICHFNGVGLLQVSISV